MVEAVLRDRKPLVTFIGSLLVLLMLMSYQVTDPVSGRTVLGNVFFQIFSPLQSGVTWAFGGAATNLRNYFSLVGTNKENEQLRKEVGELRIQLAETSGEQKENERLRQILKLGEKLPYGLLAGEVTGRDAKAVSSTITVNRGKISGVRLEMPVVTPAGIVGMTIQATPRTAQVQLITDTASATGVMLQRNDVSGILVGGIGGRCILKYLPVISDVKKDDVIVTSGQDGVFPAGLPVGTILAILNESDLYKSAEVIPYQDFSSLREVVFLLQTPNSTPAQAQ